MAPLLVSLCLLLASPIAPGLAPPADPAATLARGARQVREGAFDDALVTLDDLVRTLSTRPQRSRELVRAYVHLAEAYLGLGQPSLAQAKLLKALDVDAKLTLDPSEFPRTVLRALEDAKKAHGERADLQKQSRRKSGKWGLIALGGGAAVAGGVVLAVAPKERTNRPPVASLTVSPDGQALVQTTRMTFTASASDPDNEPLTLTWDFGDGGAPAEGTTASHVFAREGVFKVTLTARDGLNATASATQDLTARTLTGRWRPSTTGCDTETAFDIQQNATTLLVGVSFDRSDVYPSTPSVAGTTTDPRRVSFRYGEFVPRLGYYRCHMSFSGEADASLQSIRGTVSYDDSSLCGCSGRQEAMILARQ